MSQKSIKKNYMYNMILTTLNMIFPLITAPYLSIVLGAENIGKVNYATSIVSWFLIFATFGIPRYGIRAIAKNRDNKEEMSNVFWNLISIQAILSGVMIVIYLGIILSVPRFEQDLPLFILMIVQLILSIFSIDWFFQGIEEYGYITVRNIIVKVISIGLIFLIIKNQDDYLLYALVNIIGLSFNNVLNFFQARKKTNRKSMKLEINRYVLELRVYFLTTLIIALYTQFDQLILGSISETELAYHVRSKTLYGVGVSVVTSIITVLIPRIAYLAHTNYTEYKAIINESINYIYLLSFPCVVGLFLLAEEIMFMFGGEEFLPASLALKIICFQVLITPLGSYHIQQILLPNGKENIAFKIQSIAAIFSIITNVLLIPRIGFIGAAITWLMTETLLATIEAIYVRRVFTDIRINYFSSSFFKYLVAATLMGGYVYFVKIQGFNSFITILLSVSFAPIIYFGVILLLRDKIILNGAQQVIGRFIKKKSV